MKFTRILSVTTLAVLAAGPLALAGGRNPGSTLVFPVQRSGQGWFTIVSVTNTNVNPLGGATLVHYEYVNTIYNPAETQQPLGCTIFDRIEYFTAADTLSVVTSCHNATAGQQQGYLVVSAQDPTKFGVPWSHNWLMGSELVLNGSGGMYSINAIPFEAIPAAGLATDVDGDLELDFNGVEYEGIPETLYIDSFIALAGSQLALINLTGTPDALVTVQFDVWNDNEFPLSTTKLFKCWFDERLVNVSPLFDQFFLFNNTPDDPEELDLDCNNINDAETGWARINGVVANSPFSPPIPNPALLGSITSGPQGPINGGHLLWESKAKQLNGTFLGS